MLPVQPRARQQGSSKLRGLRCGAFGHKARGKPCTKPWLPISNDWSPRECALAQRISDKKAPFHIAPGRNRLCARACKRHRTVSQQHDIENALRDFYSSSSRPVLGSHLTFLVEFCAVAGKTPVECLPPNIGPDADSVRFEQAELPSALVNFVVRFSRTGRVCNTAVYTRQVLASIRSYYAELIGWRPDLSSSGASHDRIKAVMRGCAKVGLASLPKRRPILLHHMRASRARLDLCANVLHRVVWALWASQWHGFLRNLICGKRGRVALGR